MTALQHQVPQDLEFLLLGPLEVRRGRCRVPVRGRRERAVLAMLLLADGGTVAMERLVAAVWDDDPPSGAVKTVRNIVSALRCRHTADGLPAIPIDTTLGGYRLPTEAGRPDAREFRHWVAAARERAAAGDAAGAAPRLQEALRLWRGPALDGTGGRIMRDCAAGLEEQRISALEDRLELELSLGRHRQVIGELEALAREYPLRERVVGQLMLALYRSGRQAEALNAYLRLAQRLVNDLGIDPIIEVAHLYEAILRHDPALLVRPANARG
jgi:DNA-binding SARP family transcriptional activator